MLTQSQIDAIAEAVVQSMKPAPAPDIKNSTGAARGINRCRGQRI